jgi:hypothetical protein
MVVGSGRPKISGWYRIAILASVLWTVCIFVGARIWYVNKANDVYSSTYHFCHTGLEKTESSMPGAVHQSDYSRCFEFAGEFRELYLEGWNWFDSAFTALVPLSLFWLFGYLIIVAVRWIRRGFSTPTEIA